MKFWPHLQMLTHGRSFCNPKDSCVLLLRVSLHPILSRLLKLLTIVLVLIRDGRLNGIVGIGFDQESLNEAEDCDDLVWRLPLIRAQHAQTHGALVIVADIGMVDFGFEGDDGWLEGILVGECDLEQEVAAL